MAIGAALLHSIAVGENRNGVEKHVHNLPSSGNRLYPAMFERSTDFQNRAIGVFKNFARQLEGIPDARLSGVVSTAFSIDATGYEQ